jgi:hypothetical protein
MHFAGTVTQTAADTTTSTTVATGITSSTVFAIKVHYIKFNLRPTSAKLWATGLATQSFEVKVVFNQSGFEEKFTLAFTTNGVSQVAMHIPTQYELNVPDDFPLVADESITVTVMSTGTTVANIVDWRVDYERVVLSSIELSKVLLTQF